MKIYLHVTYMQLKFSLLSLNLHHYKFLKIYIGIKKIIFLSENCVLMYIIGVPN